MNTRKTRQKDAIRKAFIEADRPLSPQQVLEVAQAEVEGLGIATVYRNIKTLLAEDWLCPIEVPGAGTVYERSGKEHHHHFRCDQCNGVFELSGCVPSIARLVGCRFSVKRHELILYGTCADCKADARA